MVLRLAGPSNPRPRLVRPDCQVGDIITLSKTKEIPDETFDHFLPVPESCSSVSSVFALCRTENGDAWH